MSVEKYMNSKLKKQVIYETKLYFESIIRETKTVIGAENNIEISHHYGIENFKTHGAIIVDVINRSYCKKFIIMLPNQKHPAHYHKLKEETFRLLWGDLLVTINGKTYSLEIGENFLVKQNEVHSFSSNSGCIFEEISTKHYLEDSFYIDSVISNNKYRKTKIQR